MDIKDKVIELLVKLLADEAECEGGQVDLHRLKIRMYWFLKEGHTVCAIPKDIESATSHDIITMYYNVMEEVKRELKK